MPVESTDFLGEVRDLVESTDLPTLETLQKVLWMSPKLIQEAEEEYARAREYALVKEKMIKHVHSVIYQAQEAGTVKDREAAAYVDCRYVSAVHAAGEAISAEAVALAKLNAARNRSRAAETLISVEQTVMKTTAR